MESDLFTQGMFGISFLMQESVYCKELFWVVCSQFHFNAVSLCELESFCVNWSQYA